jgi:hypothetical protein
MNCPRRFCVFLEILFLILQKHSDGVLADFRRLATPVGRRMFSPKRLVVYTRDGIRTPGILLREGATSGPAPTVHVLEIRTRRDQRDSTDLLPYLPKFRSLFTRLPLQHKKSIVTKALHIPVSDIEYVPSKLCPFPQYPMDPGNPRSPLPLKIQQHMI